MLDVFFWDRCEDRASAQRFAEAIAAQGFDVSGNRTLRAVEAYDEATERALRTAKRAAAREVGGECPTASS